MLVELLVVTTCLQQKGGCSESTSAYYEYNKEAKQAVKTLEDIGNKIIVGNEWIVYTLTPIYAAMAGKTADFKIYRGLILGVNVKQEVVSLQWNY